MLGAPIHNRYCPECGGQLRVVRDPDTDELLIGCDACPHVEPLDEWFRLVLQGRQPALFEPERGGGA